MDFMSAMEIAASGLRANRTRMNLSASNLANANSTRSADGGPYRRRDAVFTAQPLSKRFGEVLGNKLDGAVQGVEVSGIVRDPRPPRTVYDPGHPDADARGIVKLPNINMVEEMVDMITASRAYEAGVSTLQTIKAMASKALSIGK
ncbi:MAG: flagellar basal body rod protein FlgC [Myxococcales bacterium]|nr:flagellar basal body rod protein FlgC [Myxococcales bacterium]